MKSEIALVSAAMDDEIKKNSKELVLKNYKTEYFTIKELEKSQLISLVKNLHLKIKDLLQKPQLLEGSINRLSNDKTLSNIKKLVTKLK